MNIRTISFTLALFASSSYAWQEGKTEYFPLDCDSLIKNGADKLIMEITAESGANGVPYLVGTKAGKRIWSTRFTADEVNLAKFHYTCYKNTITLWSAYPGPNERTSQIVIWNGKYIEKPIKFANGKNGTTIYKKIPPNQVDRYSLWAKKEQQTKIIIQNLYAPTYFEIYEGNATKPINIIEFYNESIEWKYTFPKTGEYKIVIKNNSANKSKNDLSIYNLKIEIN